ncbi:hypothetical protein [Azospirillum doebereinerae]
MPRDVTALPDLVNANARLVHRGRFLTATVRLDVGSDAYLIAIDKGRIAELRKAPFVMPSWTFGLSAPADSWERFWQAVPPPGYHDLFALLRRGDLTLSGNLQPFMANLLYIKDVMASLRSPKESVR